MDFNNARRLLDDLSPATAIQLLKSTRFYPSHRALLKLASQVQDDPKNDGLLGLSCAAYGWMPTILKNWDFENFNVKNPIAVVKNLNDVTSARNFLEQLKTISPINKSWIGLSKTLHCLNPELFPIWDSRVAKHFELNSHAKLNKKDVYIAYFSFIHANLDRYPDTLAGVADYIKNDHDYRPTRVRCLEILLFESPIK